MRKVGLVILTLCTAFLSLNIAEAVEDSPSSRATLKGLPGLSVGARHRFNEILGTLENALI